MNVQASPRGYIQYILREDHPVGADHDHIRRSFLQRIDELFISPDLYREFSGNFLGPLPGNSSDLYREFPPELSRIDRFSLLRFSTLATFHGSLMVVNDHIP